MARGSSHSQVIKIHNLENRTTNSVQIIPKTRTRFPMPNAKFRILETRSTNPAEFRLVLEQIPTKRRLD